MHSEHKAVWNSCLTVIKQSITDLAFNSYFKPIIPIGFADDVLTIQVPNNKIYELLEEKYIKVIRNAIKSIIGPKGKLQYEIPTQQSIKDLQEVDAFGIKADQIKNPFVIPGLRTALFESDLNKNFTFEKFVEGGCNKLARNAGLAIAAKPGATAFNPLVIYGNVALGKSHLAQAIGNRIKENHPNQRVKYISCDKFTNQVVHAIKNQSIGEFSQFYNSLDTLIIDDIQFLHQKTKTQEVFFFIFNELHQNQKQLILTSDKPPKDLVGVEERLVSRFKWGLTVELQTPDFETRKSIFVSKALDMGLELPENVVDYVCYNLKNNVREIEGMLITLIAQSSLNQREIDLTLAKEVIQTFVNHMNKKISVENITSLVAEHFNLNPELIRGKSRKRDYVIPRQLTMYLAKNYTEQSLKVIGDHLGGKDHSTVIYACKAIQDMKDTDQQFQNVLMTLERKVKLNFIEQ